MTNEDVLKNAVMKLDYWKMTDAYFNNLTDVEDWVYTLLVQIAKQSKTDLQTQYFAFVEDLYAQNYGTGAAQLAGLEGDLDLLALVGNQMEIDEGRLARAYLLATDVVFPEITDSEDYNSQFDAHQWYFIHAVLMDEGFNLAMASL